MATSLPETTRYGIHENGDPLTLDESCMRQGLDIIRLMKVLAAREQLLDPNSTLEDRRELEKILDQIIITPHGDPNEEWKAFCEHHDDQKPLIRAAMNNPEGWAVVQLFTKHMAPLFGDATKQVQMPIESFERSFEEYFEIFSDVPGAISAETKLKFADALQLILSEEQVQRDENNERFLTGQVLTQALPASEDVHLLGEQVYIGIEVHRQQFDVVLRKSLAK